LYGSRSFRAMMDLFRFWSDDGRYKMQVSEKSRLAGMPIPENSRIEPYVESSYRTTTDYDMFVYCCSVVT
jgi:hypothetical protein